MPDSNDKSGSDTNIGRSESTQSAGILNHVRRILTSDALPNLLSIAALLVAALSLVVSLKQAEHTREVEKRNRDLEQLAVTLSAELVESAHATVEWPAPDYSPFRPPYLTVPVRLFVMNRTSLPQSIKGVWVSFDNDRPDDQLRYVTIDRIEETDGSRVKLPKTIAPGAAEGINLFVSLPIEAHLARKLGINETTPKSRDVGRAGSLHFVLNDAFGSELPQSLTQPIHFNLPLLSPSPGSPTHLHFKWSPTW